MVFIWIRTDKRIVLKTCKREHIILIFGEINISLKSSPWPGRRILKLGDF